jgi:hypothetical protein
MSRRMEPKNAEDIALDDKLDVFRTITRLQQRIDTRHILNEGESAIKRAHIEEVNSGFGVSSPVIPDSEQVLKGLGVGRIEAEDDAASGAGALPAGTDS